MSKISKTDQDLIQDFIQKFQFEVVRTDKNVDRQVLLNHKAGASIPLRLGELYTCRTSSKGKPTDYTAFLTNIEFRDKKFFSICVDIYLNDAIYKPDVYFYNLNFIQSRERRFPLKKTTVATHVAFWSSLRPAASLPTHHSDIAFFRAAVNKSRKPLSKECLINIRRTRHRSRRKFAEWDALKNKQLQKKAKELGGDPRCTIRVTEDTGKVVVYGIERNAPMVVLKEIKVGDSLVESKVVTEIKPDHIAVVLKKNDPPQHVSFDYKQSFWQNLVPEKYRIDAVDDTEFHDAPVADPDAAKLVIKFKKGDHVQCQGSGLASIEFVVTDVKKAPERSKIIVYGLTSDQKRVECDQENCKLVVPPSSSDVDDAVFHDARSK